MIKLNEVTIKYGSKIIFDKYSYDFENNRIYSILGRSGCGKSTLLKVIAGLIKLDNGNVSFNDTKIKKPIKEIFMMHQNYSNFPWKNCLENVLFPIKIQNKKITKQDIDKAIETLNQVGLGDSIEKYPYELSGGMNQRLALARIVVTQPPVILMDEPLSALDPKTRGEMQNLLLNLHYKTKNTIIIVTHDPDEARKLSDKIINL